MFRKINIKYYSFVPLKLVYFMGYLNNKLIIGKFSVIFDWQKIEVNSILLIINQWCVDKRIIQWTRNWGKFNCSIWFLRFVAHSRWIKLYVKIFEKICEKYLKFRFNDSLQRDPNSKLKRLSNKKFWVRKIFIFKSSYSMVLLDFNSEIFI